MKAMILAAGRGERMRPLTDRMPKALIPVAGEALIHRHLRALSAAGFREVVINHAWLGEQLLDSIGNGQAWGMHVQWSAESEALETAGGIAKALSLLGHEPFLVINADIICDFPLAQAPALAAQHLQALPGHAPKLAFCVLVTNPAHHPEGDFEWAGHRRTFSGIGIYRPELFSTIRTGDRAPLGPLLRTAKAEGRWSALYYPGYWCDVGTLERLNEAQHWLEGQPAQTHDAQPITHDR